MSHLTLPERETYLAVIEEAGTSPESDELVQFWLVASSTMIADHGGAVAQYSRQRHHGELELHQLALHANSIPPCLFRPPVSVARLGETPSSGCNVLGESFQKLFCASLGIL